MATPTWTEKFSTMTLAGTGWQNYDIYTNLSVPKGAIAAILMCYSSTGTSTTVGVRTDGSALDRYILLAPRYSTTPGLNDVMMYVKVDSSTGLIETYASTTTSVTFYCLGYWENVDFTEQFTSIMPSTASAWTDVNLNSVAGVPNGRVCSVLLCNHTYNTGYTLGVRTNGSSVVRSIPIKGNTTSGGAQCHCMTICTYSDGSGLIEVYVGSTTGTYVYSLGYFGENMEYSEDIQTGSIGSTGWSDWDLTAYLDVEPRVVEVLSASSRASTTAYQFGVRANGSALSRYFYNDGAGSSLYTPVTWIASTDGSGIIELYGSSASYEYFRYMGYYIPVAPVVTFTQCVVVG